MQGLDRGGRPIVVGVGSRHLKFKTKEEARNFCTYALDTAVAVGWVCPPTRLYFAVVILVLWEA